MKKLHFKTVILSDVHLGAPDCQIDRVNHFLLNIRCKKLILNGDIIDGWSLARKGGWTKDHSRFVRLVLKLLEKKDTHVVYTRGNHDDVLSRFLPLHFENLEIVEEHIHRTPHGDYLVVHGDCFDAVTANCAMIAKLGDVGYQALLKLNRLYNRYRAFRGKEYYSLSKAIKAKVKSAVSFVSKFEDQLQALAKRKECKGIMCGHIHTAANKQIGDIHYLNSGDWVESCTALVEYEDGEFEILSYEEFEVRLERQVQQHLAEKLACEGEISFEEVSAAF